MDMDRSVRLFLCARCRDQVLLCSDCDRGQQYCSRECSSMTRRERRRETAERYQSSRRGRVQHAARTARWRERRRSLRQTGTGGGINKVTHQGCLEAAADASLIACDIPSASEPTIDTESVNNITLGSADATPVAAPATWLCRRCSRPVLPHVRQGWLRTNSVRWRDGHDHSS
jgi:hypothetical protein